MAASFAEAEKRYIRGPRPLRIVKEDPKKFNLPTSQAAFDALKAQGYPDEVIFNAEVLRIQPHTDYSMGGGPIYAYEFSGMALERVARLVPLDELSEPQRAYVRKHGITQIAELKRYDRHMRIWTPVKTRRVVADSPIG